MISLYLILISTFCFSQTQQEITNYLESKFPMKKRSVCLGCSFYDPDSKLEFYADDLLKKKNPEISFYLFTLKERGCYGLFPRKSILVTENGKISFIQLGLGVMMNDKGINSQFVELFKNIELDKSISLEQYTEHIAKLIFKMYFDSTYEISKNEENIISYKTKSKESIIFDLSQRKIQNIRFENN